MSTNKTVLLTLGRLPVSLDIARAFSAGGWRVIVADPWQMHLARLSSAVSKCVHTGPPRSGPAIYAQQLADVARREDVDLVVPVSEEAVYVAALKNSTDRVFCMRQDDMLRLHDKLTFIQMAESFGLAVPKTADAIERPAFVDAQPFVCKPRFSCSGRGVELHEAGGHYRAGREAIVQERLQGDAVSACCIAHDGKTTAFAAYRGTLLDGSVSVAFERVEKDNAVREWATDFIEQSSHTGFISFDFIVDAHGVARAIECNPRATSGIHFLQAAALRAAILGEAPPQSQFRTARQLMESYSCFTALLKNMFQPTTRRRAIKVLRDAKDIVWSPGDRWPFLLMMVGSWKIVLRTMTSSHSFASAAIEDVEWKPRAVNDDA